MQDIKSSIYLLCTHIVSDPGMIFTPRNLVSWQQSCYGVLMLDNGLVDNIEIMIKVVSLHFHSIPDNKYQGNMESDI